MRAPFVQRASGHRDTAAARLRVLILGVNGFLGRALAERVLAGNVHEVHGVDFADDRLAHLRHEPAFHFQRGDVCLHAELVEERIKHSDVVVPLFSVAATLDRACEPLRALDLELELEEAQRIVRYTALLRCLRLCAEHGSRLVCPMTSETHGPAGGLLRDGAPPRLGKGSPAASAATPSQRLLARVILSHAQHGGLRFSVFRPLEWLGPGLDEAESARVGSSLVVAQLIHDLVAGLPLILEDGGRPRRCFTDVADGVECLYRIVENPGGVCDGKVFDIGNAGNVASIEHVAELLAALFEAHELRGFFPPFAGIRKVERRSAVGEGHAVPCGAWNVCNADSCLGWTPGIALGTALARTLDDRLRERVGALKARLVRHPNVLAMRLMTTRE